MIHQLEWDQGEERSQNEEWSLVKRKTAASQLEPAKYYLIGLPRHFAVLLANLFALQPN